MKALFILITASSFQLNYNFKNSAGQLIPSTSNESIPAILGLTLLKEPEDALLTSRGAYLNQLTQIILPPNTISADLPLFSSYFSLSTIFLPYSPGCFLNLKFSLKGSAKLCWTKTNFGLLTNTQLFLSLFQVPANFYNNWNLVSLRLYPGSSKGIFFSEMLIKSYENEEKFYNSYEDFEQVLPEFLIFKDFFGFVSNFFISNLEPDILLELDELTDFYDSTENLCPDACPDFCYKDEIFVCVPSESICGSKFFDFELGLCFEKVHNCIKQVSNYCVKCEFGYILSETMLYCTSHNVHQKIECYEECATCDGPTFKDCLTCVDANAAPNPSGQCKCKTNFHQYNNNPLACTYKNCDSDCLYCTGPGSSQCIQCSDSNAYLDSSNNCVCISGYYDIGSSSVTCSTCHEDCKTCNGGLQTSCIECKDTNSHIDSISSMCSCDEGFYLASASSLVCQVCNSVCRTCYGPDANQCTGCFSYASLNSNGNCITICSDGYAWEDNTCKQCHESCLTCTSIGESDCISCSDSNAEVSSISGKCECTTGYIEFNNVCTKCHDSCLNCTGINDSDCISCNDFNAKISPTSGKCECTTGYTEFNNTCIKCHESCLNCTGITSTDCISCNDNNADVSLLTSECECKSGFYLSNFTTPACLQCDESCLTCSGGSENDCLDCSDPNSYISNNGSCTCIEGYIKKNPDNFTCIKISKENKNCDPGFYHANLTCEQCSQNCSECTNFDLCTACKDPVMIIIEQKCTCPEDFLIINGTCACSSNQYKLNNTCQNCLTGCAQCSSNLDCTEAASGYYLESGIPYPCHKSCAECTGPTANKCSACFVSQNLTNSTCECPDSQYFNDSKCVPCSKNCKKCSSSSICKLCKASFILDSSFKCSDSVVEDQYLQVINSFSSSVKYASFAFAYVSASLTSNPTVVWTTINTVQMLCYIPLQNIELPRILHNFFKSLQPISLIPNLWNIFEVHQCESSLIPPFYKYEYTCEYFITNTGGVFLAFLVSILYLLTILLLFCICIGKPKKFLLILIRKYRWSYFLRFWMEAYLDIAIPCIISMNNLSLESENKSLNSTFGFVFMVISSKVILSMTPFFTYFFIKSTIYAFENDDFQNVSYYSPFFQEFQYKRGLNYLLFTPYFFLRRILYAIILYQFTNFPIIQVGLNIFHTLVLIIYLIKHRPFNEKHLNITNICQEFLICIVFGLSGLYILEMDETQSNVLQIVIISIVSIVIGISYAQVAYFTIQKIVEFIRNRRNKNKFTAINVSPVKSSPRNLVFFKSKPDVSAIEEFKDEIIENIDNSRFQRRDGFLIQSEFDEKKKL